MLLHATIDKTILLQTAIAAGSNIAVIGGYQMFAVNMEEVGDRTTGGNGSLALSCRLEPDHISFSPPDSQMPILRSVIQTGNIMSG